MSQRELKIHKYLSFLLLISITVEADQNPLVVSKGTCYYKAGAQANSAYIPCGNSAYGVYSCCMAGDQCLSSNACYNVKCMTAAQGFISVPLTAFQMTPNTWLDVRILPIPPQNAGAKAHTVTSNGLALSTAISPKIPPRTLKNMGVAMSPINPSLLQILALVSAPLPHALLSSQTIPT